MLTQLEQELDSGDLRNSEFGPLVLEALQNRTGLNLAEPFEPGLLVTGIELSDFYVIKVRQSRGQEDWQLDYFTTVMPILIAVAQSFQVSVDVHVVVIRLCESLAQQLHLTLKWPTDSNKANEVKNTLYRECLDAKGLDSHDVISTLKGLTITGPS